MAITHSSQIQTAISRLPQTAYGTPRASTDDFRRIISDQRGVFSDTLNFGNDAGYENGSDLPSEYWAETADTGGTITPRFNFQDIGTQLHRALGAVSTTGTSPTYTHVFTPQSMNVSRQLPASTFLKKYGGLRLEMFPDMVSTAFSISSGKSGRIATSQTFVGSGDVETDPAGYTMPALTVGGARDYAYANQAASIAIAAAGPVTESLGCLLEDWTLTLNNPTADDGYRICSDFVVDGDPLSGQTRAEYLVGARDYMFRFTARDDGTNNLRTWLRAGTELDVTIPITDAGTGFSLTIHHTRGRVVEAAPITGAGGDFIGKTATVSLLASAAGDGTIPLTCTLVNDIASYTT